MMVTLHHDTQSAPDFAAPIYALAPYEMEAPRDKIPLFILCADDDASVPPIVNSVRIYDLWHRAGISAELHIMVNGGHGFGMKKHQKTTDSWTDLFTAWLRAQKLLSTSP